MQHEHTGTISPNKRELLDGLIRERLGVDVPLEFFFTNGDGRYLPGTRIEETSGYVLSAADRIFYFRFGWDREAGAPALLRWREATPQPRWEQSEEYRQDRERLGLG